MKRTAKSNESFYNILLVLKQNVLRSPLAFKQAVTLCTTCLNVQRHRILHTHTHTCTHTGTSHTYTHRHHTHTHTHTHTTCLRLYYDSQNMFLKYHWHIFVMETLCVYFEVGSVRKKLWTNFRLHGYVEIFINIITERHQNNIQNISSYLKTTSYGTITRTSRFRLFTETIRVCGSASCWTQVHCVRKMWGVKHCT